MNRIILRQIAALEGRIAGAVAEAQEETEEERWGRLLRQIGEVFADGDWHTTLELETRVDTGSARFPCYRTVFGHLREENAFESVYDLDAAQMRYRFVGEGAGRHWWRLEEYERDTGDTAFRERFPPPTY